MWKPTDSGLERSSAEWTGCGAIGPLGAGASLEGVLVPSTAVHYSAEWTSAVPAAPTRNIGGDERGQDSVNRIIKS